MNIIADLHTHTLRCGHAYSSLGEMAEGARRNGVKIMATTDHGPNMPGAATLDFFRELPQIPRTIAGVRILKGVETNIAGFHGELDVPDDILVYLDLVNIGFHPLCGYEGKTQAENTRTLLKAMSNPLVDLVVHPGNPQFPVDVEQMVQAAIEYDVIIEINNSSFRGSRIGSWDNCTRIARACQKAGAFMSLDSDAHISFDVGRLNYGLELLQKAEIGPEAIINTSEERVMEFIQRKKRIKEKILAERFSGY